MIFYPSAMSLGHILSVTWDGSGFRGIIFLTKLPNLGEMNNIFHMTSVADYVSTSLQYPWHIPLQNS